MKRLLARSFTPTLLLLAVASCSRPGSDAGPAPPTSPPMAAGDVTNPTAAGNAPQIDSELKQFKRFGEEMRQHLRNEEFDVLDRVADELRTTNARYTGGAWKLAKYYDGLFLTGK